MCDNKNFISYRLSNIFHGGKQNGVTCWGNVPTYFPNSLGHLYVKENNGRTHSGSWGGWRSNINVIKKIITIYEAENKNYIEYGRKLPGDDEVVIHLRMGDVIGSTNTDYPINLFKYKDAAINVYKSHVHTIEYYEKVVQSIINIKKNKNCCVDGKYVS